MCKSYRFPRLLQEDVESIPFCLNILRNFIDNEGLFLPEDLSIEEILDRCSSAITSLHFLYALLTMDSLADDLASYPTFLIDAYNSLKPSNPVDSANQLA